MRPDSVSDLVLDSPKPPWFTWRTAAALLLGAVFLVLLGWTAFYVRTEALREMHVALRRDADSVVQNLDGSLRRASHFLDLLVRYYQSDLDNSERVMAALRVQELAPAERFSVYWLSPALEPRWSYPPTAAIRKLPPLSEDELLLVQGLRSSRAAFCRAFMDDGRIGTLDVLLPVYAGDELRGYLGARYLLANVLRNAVPDSFSDLYAVTLVKGEKEVLASFTSDRDLDDELQLRRPLPPPLAELALVLNRYDLTWRSMMRVGVLVSGVLALVVVIAMYTQNREIERRRLAEAEKDRLIKQLREALQNIKTLKQMLPICMYCKKVRTDQDYWQQIESYIQEQTGTDFSHGICPTCYETVMKPLLEKARAEAPGRRSGPTTGQTPVPPVAKPKA